MVLLSNQTVFPDTEGDISNNSSFIGSLGTNFPSYGFVNSISIADCEEITPDVKAETCFVNSGFTT